MSDNASRAEVALPRGWANPLLIEIAQVNPPLDRCIANDSVRVNFVPMRSVEPEGGGLIHPDLRTYAEVKKGYTSFLSGDVIMAKITPCMENGKTTVVPELPGSVCFGSTEFHVIRPGDGIVPSWISNFLLQHEVRRVAQRSMSGGVGQMRVPASFLEKIRIPLAPADEQRRIVDALDELLSDLDAGGAALERVRTKLAQYRASILNVAVEGALTVDWRRQHPLVEPAPELLKRILAERRHRWEEEQIRKFKKKGQELPKNWKAKYKEPASPYTRDLSPLPAGWCWATLDQVLWLLRSGTAETSGRETTDYPVLKSSAVRHGSIDFKDLNYLQESQSIRSDNYLQQGDLLITRLSGSVEYVGCCAFVGALPSKKIQYPDRIFCGKLVPGADGVFLSYCFRHPRLRATLEEAAKSTAGHQRISMSDLYPLSFPLPPLSEQAAIVEAVEDQVSVLVHLESDIVAKLKSTQVLRQAILRHAFTGQLMPQDPTDEPASLLLKQNAAEREARARESAAAKRTRKKTNALASGRLGRPKRIQAKGD